jgi:hypothetical protein
MTRRDFLWVTSAAAVAPAPASASPQTPLLIPVNLVIDEHAKLGPKSQRKFWSRIWPEAHREFERSGIWFRCTRSSGGVERPENCEPIVSGLRTDALNLVVTGSIPMEWDRGLALSGVATRYRGRHLCMIALQHAHGNQIPLLSLNTCVHEILHALLHDIFENRPAGVSGQMRELRVDWYATRLWLFHDGAAIRQSAQQYVERAAFPKLS